MSALKLPSSGSFDSGDHSAEARILVDGACLERPRRYSRCCAFGANLWRVHDEPGSGRGHSWSSTTDARTALQRETALAEAIDVPFLPVVPHVLTASRSRLAG